METQIRVNQIELEKLPISDLYAVLDSLEGVYVGVDFFKEKSIISDEIDKRVKLVFPDFNKYKDPKDY